MELVIKRVENLTLDGSAEGIEDDIQSLVAESAEDDDASFRASVGAAADETTDDLTGVVWAAGDHTLYVNGRPTPVHVPEDSIQRTYDSVQSTVEAGDPPDIGLDHGDSVHKDTVPVAAELDILKIGKATEFGLSEDGTKIAMTDYDLTEDKAKSAAESGQFAGKDYSIVGALRIQTENGQPKTVESGGKERLVVAAETIRQVDMVDEGAVEIAGPGGDLPPLQTAASLAAENPTEPATAFTSSLRFVAQRATDSDMESLNELKDLDDPDEILDGAASVVEAKDEQITALETVVAAAGVDPTEVVPDDADDVADEVETVQAHAEAAETLADFHDVDLAAEDAGPQALVDEHTEDLRKDVAAKEATLPGYDTGADDGQSVDDRAEDLKGKSPQALQAMNGERANEILQSEQAQKEYGQAFAAGDGVEGTSVGSGGGDDGGTSGGEKAEVVAERAMTVDEKIEFKDSDADDAAEFMAGKYGEDPADFVNEDDPSGAFIEATAGEAEQ